MGGSGEERDWWRVMEREGEEGSNEGGREVRGMMEGGRRGGE